MLNMTLTHVIQLNLGNFSCPFFEHGVRIKPEIFTERG